MIKSKAQLFSILAVAGLLCLGIIGLAQISNNGTANNNGDEKKKNVEKRVEIYQEDNNTRVKITTIEDGKETVEVYEGEEAEKYLEEHNHGFGTHSKSGSNGTSNFNFHYNFQKGMGQLDSILNGMDFDWSFSDMSDIMNEEQVKELEEMMEKLKDHDFKMDFDFDFDNLEDLFKNFSDSSHFDIKMFGGDNMEELEEMLKKMNIDIDIDMSTSDPSGKKITKVIVARSVTIEDMEASKKSKELSIEELKFYPNPTNGQFTLEFFVPSKGTTNITINDMNGKLVYANSVEGEGSHKKEIDISNAGNGMYILNLSQGKKSTSKKIVID
jgi:hypothetical protein